MRKHLVLWGLCLSSLAAASYLSVQRPAPPPTSKAAAAGDRKSVIFNWMWYTGMLRGVQEVDAVATLELQATGIIQVQGQPCKLTKYRASINYQVSGMRVQYTCALPNGRSRKA